MLPVQPRNKEQHFALDALLDDDIKLVTLMGKAGTGKTLLAIAAASAKPSRNSTYQNCWSPGRSFPWARTSGFCPGDVEEKLDPWMQPISRRARPAHAAAGTGGADSNAASIELLQRPHRASSRSPTSAAAASPTSS